MGWVSSKDYSATWGTMRGVTIIRSGESAQFVVDGNISRKQEPKPEPVISEPVVSEPVVSEPKEESAPKKVADESEPAAKRVAKKTTPKKKTEPKTEKVEAPVEDAVEDVKE